MKSRASLKPLTLFIHRASAYLTDHEAHGEGLICFSLLKGLAERGHRIHACTSQQAIHKMPTEMSVYNETQRSPANSLAPWEYAYQASRRLRHLMKFETIDLVWHMNPTGISGCPCPPKTYGLPLALGPLYYSWPEILNEKPHCGQPRFGFGLQPLLTPLAKRGWHKTLYRSEVIFCATAPHAAIMQQQLPHVLVFNLPLIAEPPIRIGLKMTRFPQIVTLLFAANLVSNKNPMVFSETIYHLRQLGITAEGIVLGDGAERAKMQAYCHENGLTNAVCFRGKVPNTEVYEHLSEADFLVSTSRGEPYGRSIAEAMSVGTPAICHHSGGPADFIDDGTDGLLVSELTGQAYAEKIKRVLTQPGVYALLSQNAKRKAEQWTSEAVISRLETALRKACR